jgi:hypothetical protein
MSDEKEATENGNTEVLRKSLLQEGVSYLKLAKTKCAGKMYAAGANSLIASLNGVAWGDFTASQKVVAFLTMTVAMWQVMDAFLNTQMRAFTETEKAQIAAETSKV